MATPVITPQILNKDNFTIQFEEGLDFCESSSTTLKLAYGRSSALTKKITQWVTAKKDLFAESKKQDKLDKKKRNPIGLRALEKTIQRLEKIVAPMRANYTTQIYDLYANASTANLPCILLGNSELRSSPPELRNFGVLSYGETACPKKLRAELPTFLRGSILNDGSWSVLKNDAFILGAIHGHKTIYIVSEGYKHSELVDKLTWDKKADRPSLTGREVLMLHSAGYRQVASPKQAEKFGYTFVCLDKEKANRTNILDLITAAGKVTTQKDIRMMFEQDSPYKTVEIVQSNQV